mmetsp:Transcript_18740/g.16968  ORF Transcript_18740/g.16968 Transcript_18740/m.16968 type:complete len:824 (+) Transcript_18740:57-2528(+)
MSQYDHIESNEPMVEVTWNGSTIFVPQNTAYYDESTGLYSYGGEESNDYINDFDFTNWLTSIPAPNRKSLANYQTNQSIRIHYQQLDLETLKELPPNDERYKEIPIRYQSIYQLDHESTIRDSYGSFGYPSIVYKVVDKTDSNVYALRRFDNIRISPAVIKNAPSKWFTINHSSIVPLYHINQEMGALFFTYAYYPGAQTLKQRFIDQPGPPLNESLIWRITIQLLSAIRYIHSQNMAIRAISPIHVLLTSGSIARINSVGVIDITEFESHKSLNELQIDDYIKLAYTLLSLTYKGIVTNKNVDQAINKLQQYFSPKLNKLIQLLISTNTFIDKQIDRSIDNSIDRSIDRLVDRSIDIDGFIGIGLNPSAPVFKSIPNQLSTFHSIIQSIEQLVTDSLFDEYNSLSVMNDNLSTQLRCEYENSRLLNLVIKLGLINERPGNNTSSNYKSINDDWSEVGDRYILKLFRDYLFHQSIILTNDKVIDKLDRSNDSSKVIPAIDIGHIISSLNKLDAGDSEQIVLSSRDNKDLFIVTYYDVKRCLEDAISELSNQSTSHYNSPNQADHQIDRSLVNNEHILISNRKTNSYTTNYSNYQPTNLSNQLTNQLTNHLTSQPINQLSNQLANQSIQRSNSQSSNHQYNDSTNILKPTAQPYIPTGAISEKITSSIPNYLTNQITNQLPNQLTNQLINQRTNYTSNYQSNQSSNNSNKYSSNYQSNYPYNQSNSYPSTNSNANLSNNLTSNLSNYPTNNLTNHLLSNQPTNNSVNYPSNYSTNYQINIPINNNININSSEFIPGVGRKLTSYSPSSLANTSTSYTNSRNYYS